MEITTRFVDEVEVFLLGAREMADAVTGIEGLLAAVPIGSAIMGKGKRDQVDFHTPNGKVLSVEILDVVPLRG